MKTVGKYNLFKGLSTVATVGTPIITLSCCSDLFVRKPETSISAAGMFAIFIALLFAKDKIAENLKMPSAAVVSLVGLILIVMIENLLIPMKAVCIATLVTSGIDEFTFKRFYKSLESELPEIINKYKHFGFLFCKTDNLKE